MLKKAIVAIETLEQKSRMRKGRVLKWINWPTVWKKLGIVWSGRSIRNLERGSVNGMEKHDMSSLRSGMISTCDEYGRGGSGYREGRIKDNSTW